ncbi:MAG: 16S rRNA (cytosine(1402)-N(4))-methyltransferase RsmH [Pseudomonadota bacterium]
MPSRTRPQEKQARGGHRPVLLDETLDALAPVDGATYIDGTFGGGGYAKALLETANCTVWGIDRDPEAIASGAVLAQSFGRRLHLLQGRFGEMAALLREKGVTRVDGIALDLGVSSMQLDQPDRGFSFREDGPLDMRMEKAGRSAADVVNQEDEQTLVAILLKYGEERKARRIARRIVEARVRQPITRTRELAELVASVVKPTPNGTNPATRTFQALRIYVNDELGEIERGLRAAEVLLKPAARIAVVAFHSLEDRPVKTFFRLRSEEGRHPSRHLPVRHETAQAPSFRLLSRRAIRPTAAELAANPRARSARLRAAERTAAPPWEMPA